MTGKTLAENVEHLPGLKEGQDIIKPLSSPIKKTGMVLIRAYGQISTRSWQYASLALISFASR